MAGESHPDHATIARFRKDHADALSDLFVQVLELCQKAGMMRLRAKLKRSEGREQDRARKWMVEPVFGQIKEAMGFRHMPRRGLQAARAEWGFVCTVHNLLELWRARAPLPA
ncbi:MAG: transposase [Myxococcota bacterium]